MARASTNTALDPDRVAWVQNLMSRVLIHGSRERAIMAEFGIQRRQANNYILAARKEIRDAQALNKEERREALRHILGGVIERATESNDHRSVVSALRELASLDGLNEPDRIELTGSLSVVETDPVKARARLEDLRKIQG